MDRPPKPSVLGEYRSDAELLAATDGDPDAFGDFYRRHIDAILGYFWTRTRDRDVTLDLASETFAAALEGRSKFDPERGVPVQWVFGIAKHQLSQFWRRQKVSRRARERLRIITPVTPAIGWEDLESVEARIDAGRLHAALARVPVKNREAVRLRVVEERDYAEIAEQLSCTAGAARVRVLRGLRQLEIEFDSVRAIGGEELK